MTASPGALARRLVDSLVEQGEMSERWAEVLAAVPRHLFIPDTIYRHEDGRPGNDLVPLRRGADPEGWLRLVYSDQPVNTQVDGGRPDVDGAGFEVTSSSSQPSVVAGMLEELAAAPGDRVLEIGTGTGWNAALLAQVVGAHNVVSVELDPAIAGRARASLTVSGCRSVTVVTGDGVHGHRPGAPYARVISTVGVSSVPYAWVAQTGRCGRIVAPLTGEYHPPGVVCLVRDVDGTATGRLAGDAAFMGLRGTSRRVRGSGATRSSTATSETDLHPYRYAGDRNAATAIGLRVHGVHKVWTDDPDRPGTGTLWLYGPESGSRATVTVGAGPPHPVEQTGPRRLFDEVEAAYRWWLDAGEPLVGDWLVTVTPAGQEITLEPE